MENTFVMIKPDGLRKKVFKEVLDRFLKNNLIVSNVKVLMLDKELIDKHYSHLVSEPFYPNLLKFMLSGPVIIMTVSGDNAINKVRMMIGDTDPSKALDGTIRRDFGESMSRNIIHASDSLENAKNEMERFNEYQKKIFKK